MIENCYKRAATRGRNIRKLQQKQTFLMYFDGGKSKLLNLQLKSTFAVNIWLFFGKNE